MHAPFTFTTPGRLIDFMREAGEQGLINLAAGIPGLDALPAEALRQALLQASDTEGAALFAYHHPEGDWRLRELLAQRLRLRGAAVQAGEVFTVTGCQQALQIMLDVLAQSGDVVACEVPVYYALLELIAARGCRILPVPVRSAEGFDLDEVDRLLGQWKPRCLFVCTTLSNPTGATIPEANRPRLVEICRRHGVRVVEDDIYAKLVDSGAPPPLRAFDDGSTVSFVSSFSKSVSPGLRVGVCVPGTIYEAAAERKVQQDMHSCVLSEVTLRCYLESGGIESHLTWLRERNARRRTLAREAIQRAFPSGTQVWPQRGGYMLWAQLSKPQNLAPVRALAREAGVVFAAGSVFYPQPPTETCLRLNCAKASEADLVRGLEALGAVLQRAAA